MKKIKAFPLLLIVIFILSSISPLQQGALATEPKDILYVFDLEAFIKSAPSTKVGYDYLKAASTLQGIVNREKPQIYFLYETNGEAAKANIDIDQYWLDKLNVPEEYLSNYDIQNVSDFYSLIDLFKNYIKGVVLWDENVSATSDVASTIAGVEDLIPIRYDTATNSVYNDLVVNRSLWPVTKNLVDKFLLSNNYIPMADLSQPTTPEQISTATPSTGSTKNDSYMWAKENYLDKGLTSKEVMNYAQDAWTKPLGGDQEGKSGTFVSGKIPEKMEAGQKQEVEITVKNNGTATWTKEELFRFGIKSDNVFTFENPLYGGEQLTDSKGARIYLDASNPIEPGEQFTFKFTIVAPNTTGDCKLSLGFVKDGVAWFGEQLTKTIVVQAYTPTVGEKGIFVSGKIPERMNPGQKQEVEITVKNTGTVTWTKEANFRLGINSDNVFTFESPLYGGEQLTDSKGARIYLDASNPIESGEQFTFKFTIVASTTTGDSKLSLALVHDGVAWLSEQLVKTIQVTDENIGFPAATEGDNALIYSINAPKYVARGDKAEVEVMVYNLGNTTWNGDYRFAAEATNDIEWINTTGAALAIDQSIAPGEKTTLKFEVNTNVAPGTYNVAGKMTADVEGNVIFGETFSHGITVLGDNAQSSVLPSQLAYDAFIYSVSVPNTLGIGQLGDVAIKVLNTGTGTWSNEGQDITSHGADKIGLSAIAPNSVNWDGPANARFYLPVDNSVEPGETVTFNGKVIRADAILQVNFACKMVYDGKAVFGNVVTQPFTIVADNVITPELTKWSAEKSLTILMNIEQPGEKSFRLQLVEKSLIADPGDLISYNDLFNTGVINSDYFIGKKAFFFDLSPDEMSYPIDDRNQILGTDTSTLKKILKSQADLTENTIFSITGFVPWHIKYTTHADPRASLAPVAAEWKMVDIFSSYGAEVDADAIGMVGLANASVFSKIPLNSNLKQNNDKGVSSAIEYDENKKYVTFYMGDYDCGAWTSGVLPVNWDDPRRGEMPLAWPVDGALASRVPHAYNYLYETATTNDYFVAGDNGTGYLNPMWLEVQNRPDGLPDLLDSWKNRNIASNQKFDIDITGFLIAGNTPFITERVQQAYSEMTPKGVVYGGQVSNPIYNETPFIVYNDLDGTSLANVEAVAQNILTVLKSRKQFFSLRSVITTPSTIYDAVKRAKEIDPSLEIEVVDPYTLMRLFKEQGGEKQVSAYVTYDSENTESPIVVDGVANISEWADAAEINVSSSSQTVIDYGKIWGSIVGDDDLKSVFKVKWDQNNLYVLEERQDNVLNLSESGAAPTYVVDSGLLMFDLSHTISGTTFTGNTYSIYYTPKGLDGDARVFLRGDGYPSGSEKRLTETQIESTIGASGYTAELAIPWSEFYNEPFTPENNKLIGFSALAIDQDGGAGFKGQIMWVGLGDDKANWADIKFVGEPTPTPTPTPTPSPVDGKVEVMPKLKNDSAESEVGKDFIDIAYNQVNQDEDGIKTIVVEVKELEAAKDYVVWLPVDKLTSKDDEKMIKIITPVGSVTVPENMFKDNDYQTSEKIGISIGIADTSGIEEKTKEKIGNRPVIELNALVDGEVIAWKNNKAPVTVSIDYKPTAEELKNSDHIIVWYIDGKGKANAVKASSYDADTGKVTFTVSHFSKYAIAYNKKTFTDISHYPWAKKEIEILASKGIVSGVTEGLYKPSDKITRGEFIKILMDSLDLTAEFNENFKDVTLKENYYEEVGIAKSLGITTGVGNDRFDPRAPISRQDMIVLTVKAMKATGITFSEVNLQDIMKYEDSDKIAGYAKESVVSLVQLGIIKGNGIGINPLGYLTRAEAAVIAYKL